MGKVGTKKSWRQSKGAFVTINQNKKEKTNKLCNVVSKKKKKKELKIVFLIQYF